MVDEKVDLAARRDAKLVAKRSLRTRSWLESIGSSVAVFFRIVHAKIRYDFRDDDFTNNVENDAVILFVESTFRWVESDLGKIEFFPWEVGSFDHESAIFRLRDGEFRSWSNVGKKGGSSGHLVS